MRRAPRIWFVMSCGTIFHIYPTSPIHGVQKIFTEKKCQQTPLVSFPFPLYSRQQLWEQHVVDNKEREERGETSTKRTRTELTDSKALLLFYVVIGVGVEGKSKEKSEKNGLFV